jgi:hypothetical protein
MVACYQLPSFKALVPHLRLGASMQPTANSRTRRRKSAAYKDKVDEREQAREEVVQTSFRLPRSRWAKLQCLCVDERLSVQSLLVAALQNEFARRGKEF